MVLASTVLQLLLCFSLAPRIHKYLRSKARVRFVERFVVSCSIGDWFVLYQMSRNMNQRFFVDFLIALIEQERPQPDQQEHQQHHHQQQQQRQHHRGPELRIEEVEDQPVDPGPEFNRVINRVRENDFGNTQTRSSFPGPGRGPPETLRGVRALHRRRSQLRPR